MCNVTGLYKHDNSKLHQNETNEKQNLMARNIWPLVQNRNEEEWALAHSDEWRFPLGRVDFCNWPAGACLSVSQSVSQSPKFGMQVVCPRTFVKMNSGRTDGPIWTRQTPKDAPKRRNDDGICHVAPRATWHVPRAAAWTLSKTILAGQNLRTEGRRDTKLSG